MRWNGKRNAQIEVPYQYWNRTCGLCGNFDGDYMNDFMTPDRSVVSIKGCIVGNLHRGFRVLFFAFFTVNFTSTNIFSLLGVND